MNGSLGLPQLHCPSLACGVPPYALLKHPFLRRSARVVRGLLRAFRYLCIYLLYLLDTVSSKLARRVAGSTLAECRMPQTPRAAPGPRDGISPFAPRSSPFARRSSLSLGQDVCLSLEQHLKKAFSVTGERASPPEYARHKHTHPHRLFPAQHSGAHARHTHPHHSLPTTQRRT